jgi:transcriptional regulator with XRE-family HTH domain
MKKLTKYKDVSQMVRETTDETFADAFEQLLRSQRIVKDLMVLRATHGLSQQDVAEKMGCTQSRISKLESSKDVDLALGDLAKYANAVGFRVAVMLEPREITAVGRVKGLAFQIKDQLDRLADLARDDQKIAHGVANFFSEAFFNLVSMLQDSAEKLPCDPKDGEPLISFNIAEGKAEGQTNASDPSSAPKMPRRKRDKPKSLAGSQ